MSISEKINLNIFILNKTLGFKYNVFYESKLNDIFNIYYIFIIRVEDIEKLCLY